MRKDNKMPLFMEDSEFVKDVLENIIDQRKETEEREEEERGNN